MSRYVFITGGVVSSLGKGLASAALAACLQARGFSTRLRKLDPYLNVDPGTMSPYQHGEVFVTDDGAETDLDLGHYERFTDVSARKTDSVSSGRIYQEVLRKEREGEYLGGTVQVVPHVTNAIKQFILNDTEEADFVLCEIGGTVGDMEGLPFLEAIRQLYVDLGRDRTAYIHVTLLPYIATAGELKTKPTQHSVAALRAIGIMPDIVLCRSDRKISDEARRKIALQCSVSGDAVVPAIDVDTIYQAPIDYHHYGLDTKLLRVFGLPCNDEPDLSRWEKIVQRIRHPEGVVKVAIVGKYTELKEAYKSLQEALVHGGIANRVDVQLDWVESSDFATVEDAAERLQHVHAILVPGGFGERGAEGKINAITYARENDVPFFGICLGMQMAVVEAARNRAGLKGAGSTEFSVPEDPIIGLMTEWVRGNEKQTRDASSDLGGTMRLGAYRCLLEPGSLVARIYGDNLIEERHRHRYEVNVAYREELEAAGLTFSGMSPDGLLPEIIEDPAQTWFVGVQFHPELKSRPFAPHPLFRSFVEAAVNKAEIVRTPSLFAVAEEQQFAAEDAVPE